MSGWVIAFGACYSCKQWIGFNPLSVPSVVIKGTREPLCECCLTRLNVLRKAQGLEPIVPAADAYEPAPESAL